MADRHTAVLARLSELGLSLAEALHARALEAEDPKVAADLGLAFHRISRSVRQSLALEAKLARDLRAEAREANAPKPDPDPYDFKSDADRIRHERRVDQRIEDLREAIEPLIWTEQDPETRDRHLAMLEDILRFDVWDETFGDEPLDEHIRDICNDMGIPRPAEAAPAAPAPTEATLETADAAPDSSDDERRSSG